MKLLRLLVPMVLVVSAFAARGFNGTTDLITIAGVSTPVDISTGPMTIALWMYPTTINTSEHDPLGKFGSTGANQQYLVSIGDTDIDGGSAAGYYVGSVSGFFGVRASCGTLTTNQWYQVTVRVDTAGVLGSGPVVYLAVSHGVACTAFANFSERRTAGGVDLNLGGRNGTANFAGRVCDVGIWDAVLSNTELQSLQSGTSASWIRPTKLVAYYPLYAAAAIEPDGSGNHLNGTLTGTSLADHCPVGSPVGW